MSGELYRLSGLGDSLIHGRMYPSTDIETGQLVVPTVRIYPVTQEDINGFIGRIYPESGAGITVMPVCFSRGLGTCRTFVFVLFIRFIESQSPATDGTGLGNEPVCRLLA